jgi:hypothetical protein
MTNSTNGVAQPVQKTPPIPFGEQVRSVSFAEDMFHVHFVDGRMLAVPIRWYPRLAGATPEQRTHWHIAEDGESIIWSHFDEAISMDELLWDGPDKHEENRQLEQNARALAADEALNVEALEWIETLISDVALDGENETEIEAKAVAWAEEILRRYQPAIS